MRATNPTAPFDKTRHNSTPARLRFTLPSPPRQPDGSRHHGIAAHKAAILAVAVALLVALFVFHMPAPTAAMSLVYGGLYGLFPIGWIVIAAMFLYTITLTNGTFETVKNSV